MKKMKKALILAGAIAGICIAAAGQESQPQSQAASSATGHFDVSNNACYNRMREVDEVRHDNFALTDDPRTALMNHGVDDKLFGVPVRNWDNAIVHEFLASVETCMEPAGMKTEFGAGLVDKVRAQFPGYLAQVRQRTDRAVLFNDKTSGGAGVTVSCAEMVEYADKRLYPTKPGYDNAVFGKKFAGYTYADYQFLRDKIDTCVDTLKQAQGDTDELGTQIKQLLGLQKDIATGWHEQQRELIPKEQAANQVLAERQVAEVEHERRKKDPTFLERIGDYMGKAGLSGLLLGIAATGVADRRYKKGYRPDKLPQKPMRIIFFSSTALLLISWLIG